MSILQRGITSTLVKRHSSNTAEYVVASQIAKAVQQALLDEAAEDDEEDDSEDDEEDDDEEEEDSDDAARKQAGIAHLKKALTSEPLNGKEFSDMDDDDDDMEVGATAKELAKELVGCAHVVIPHHVVALGMSCYIKHAVTVKHKACCNWPHFWSGIISMEIEQSLGGMMS